MPKRLDLESLAGELKKRIAEVNGCSVNCSFDSAKHTLSLTKTNGRGIPVEEFLVWNHPSEKQPIVAYSSYDPAVMHFGSNAPSAVKFFVSGLLEREAEIRRWGKLSYQNMVGAGTVPLFLNYFAEHMLGK